MRLHAPLVVHMDISTAVRAHLFRGVSHVGLRTSHPLLSHICSDSWKEFAWRLLSGKRASNFYGQTSSAKRPHGISKHFNVRSSLIRMVAMLQPSSLAISQDVICNLSLLISLFLSLSLYFALSPSTPLSHNGRTSTFSVACSETAETQTQEDEKGFRSRATSEEGSTGQPARTWDFQQRTLHEIT